jgi:hypothetical protein
MRMVWIGAAVLILALASIGLESQIANPLVGVWKVTEIVSPNGEKNSNPQPTIYIFTTRHYSHTSVTSTKPRPNYTGQNVTDAQRLEMWQPFTATAGTYDLDSNALTIRPLVAKNLASWSLGPSRHLRSQRRARISGFGPRGRAQARYLRPMPIGRDSSAWSDARAREIVGVGRN